MPPRPVTLESLRDLAGLRIDAIIDVRAPAEFAQDHVPGAVNMPVLSDHERAEVGTLYTRVSRFQARRLGAALVARNAATHLQGPLADKPADFRPLVYCWRGGMRSGSFAMILDQIGWQVGVLKGGYQSWRRLVVGALYDAPFPAPVVLLDGDTGTAKTDVLAQLAMLGVQVLDLEALAHHRGSLFGLVPGDAQPSQKGFESALAARIAALDPARPVVIEAESNRIGALRLPPALWEAMRAAPRIALHAALDDRVRYLVRAYADMLDDPAALHDRIAALAPYQPRARIGLWQEMATARAYAPLARSLMADHYDPRYARMRPETPAAQFDAGDLTAPALARTAAAIRDWLDAQTLSLGGATG